MYSFLLNATNNIVIDTPTDNISGYSASVNIGNNFFNAPNFFLGVIVGVLCCFFIKAIYNCIKKQHFNK